ncbi:hypothetical protein Ndes2437B_g08778 [Nannochloris sp. 'desiccata']
MAKPRPKEPTYTRRYSFAFFGAIPIVDAVGNEAKMWKQEAEFYRRRGGEALTNTLGGVLPSSSKGSNAAAKSIKIKQLDAEFADAMLDALLRAAGPDALSVQKYADALTTKELPFYREAGTCGHCGTKTGPSALKDRDYFDFQAYVRGKALIRSCGGGAPGASGGVTDTTCIDQLRIAVGDSVLQHILSEVDVGEAEAVGISPFRAFSATTADLLSASPELDSIRRGVRALLKYFERKGFIASHGIIFFGASKNEERNHMVWARGEPAYLQYWLVAPADLRSGSALQSEEGATIGFVASAIAAYLRRCGVNSEGLKRTSSLTDPNQVSEQWSLRRFKKLQNGGRLWERGYQDWKPDTCPSGIDADSILCGSITPSAAQSNVSKAHLLGAGSVCNKTEGIWLSLSVGGCAKPGTDIADLSQGRFEQYVEWLGSADVCMSGKKKIKKCCFREKGDQTIYQYAADYTYRCKLIPKAWSMTDKFEFQVPTAQRHF